MIRSRSFTAALLVSAAFACLAPVFGSLTTFNAPLWKGVPVDYCNAWGTDCGDSAADNYCQMMGFNGLQTSAGPVALPAYNAAGCPSQTVLPATNQICSKLLRGCQTFASITCWGATYIAWPQYNGLPLDWCREWAMDCGQAAADWFCAYKGFDGTLDFKQAALTSGMTIVPSSGQNCNSATQTCSTFSHISCY